KSRTIVVFINQIRMKIGIMFGNPETTTGGNALKFYASVRLDIRRLGALKHGDEVIGSRTKVKVVKNKVAPPFREAEFDILYGTGISKEGELIDIASEQGIVEKTGAWYAFGGDRIGQGRENARDFLRVNVFDQRAEMQPALRLIPPCVRPFRERSLPEVVERVASERRVLLRGTGTSGSGKSATLPAVIIHISRTADRHIITVQDP